MAGSQVTIEAGAAVRCLVGESALDEFRGRLREHWLLPFCGAKKLSDAGFNSNSVDALCERDAADFIDAVDRGLVKQHDGHFKTPLSKAKEQIFWQGARASSPRKITLWHEPIITMAAVARLVRDFDWPIRQLGMQSKTWAFDLVGYDEAEKEEQLLCEVKKSRDEVDRLVALMETHLKTPPGKEGGFKGAERNALRKVYALRKSPASIFWALGPNRYERIFKVDRTGDLNLIPDVLALRNPRS